MPDAQERATNGATSPPDCDEGDTSEFSASVRVQDLTHPKVKSTVPNPGATDVAETLAVSAIFSEAMKASTVNATMDDAEEGRCDEERDRHRNLHPCEK